MKTRLLTFVAITALIFSCDSSSNDDTSDYTGNNDDTSYVEDDSTGDDTTEEVSGDNPDIPYVYTVENTKADYEAPEFNSAGLETAMEALPDPFLFNNGNRVESIEHRAERTAVISASVQYYEIGTKPAVDLNDVTAEMDGETLKVTVTVNGETLELSSVITYPSDDAGPFPIMIGTSYMSLPTDLFTGRDIAFMTFTESQVNNYSQFGSSSGRGNYDFDRLYPELKENGAYAAWSWGVSRLIDGLQILGSEVTRIDTEHIGVTGCSYAGKMALFAGAFDERIALTIAQEPGGGGVATWRVSQTLDGVENLDSTDYNWFKQSLKTNFGGGKVGYLPHDRHELCAMICPRALLFLGNPDYQWLADESGYVSANAARKVWEEFGIGDRMGYSIQDQHFHCSLPSVQYPHVQAFVDKYLLGYDVDTDVRFAPMYSSVNLSVWISF